MASNGFEWLRMASNGVEWDEWHKSGTDVEVPLVSMGMASSGGW